jgi:hypothetical protein
MQSGAVNSGVMRESLHAFSTLEILLAANDKDLIKVANEIDRLLTLMTPNDIGNFVVFIDYDIIS